MLSSTPEERLRGLARAAESSARHATPDAGSIPGGSWRPSPAMAPYVLIGGMAARLRGSPLLIEDADVLRTGRRWAIVNGPPPDSTANRAALRTNSW